jgi:enamine deaminase RidA (YjgF/YER057c/UK114 family)
VLRLPGTGIALGLVVFPDAASAAFTPNRTGLDHLCFTVASRAEIDDWAARLDERHVSRSEVAEMKTGPILNFKDPDGIALSFSLPLPASQPSAAADSCEHRIINPWTWQERAGFVHGHETTGATRVLYCAGAAAVDAAGSPSHLGDMGGQALAALDNLEIVLQAAGYQLGDVVRLNTYVTDVEAYAQARPALQQRLDAAGCRYAATLLGVTRLARPELLIEIEATAAR